MRRKGQLKKSTRAVLCVVFSLLVHLPLLYWMTLAILTKPLLSSEPTYLEIMPLLRQSDPFEPTEEERQEDEDYDPQEELPGGHVISEPTVAGRNERPENPDFLANRDQVVEKQVRSVIPRRGMAQVPHEKQQSRTDGALVPQPSKNQEKLLAGLTVLKRGLQPSEEGEHVMDQAPPPSLPPTPETLPLKLAPSINTLIDAVDDVALDDLGDVEKGTENLLSTARWLHAPFFQRVHNQIGQYWYPSVTAAIQRHDPTGSIYFYRERKTVVRVVLDGQGSLKRAYLLKTSGAGFLDDVALRSFERGLPVPNPPPGLVDKKNNSIVMEYHFTVESSKRPIFRLRRYE